jgi:ElaB/YqjD/DUF883 family membrane-anchored ribosome-binding protein
MTAMSPTSQQTLSEKISDRVGDATEEAVEQVKNAATHAAELASGGLKYAGEAAEHASEVGGTFKTALEKSLRDQPRATLAGAAIVGFLLGALWKLAR